jgi:V-type H+-transporting ATPase subunit a
VQLALRNLPNPSHNNDHNNNLFCHPLNKQLNPDLSMFQRKFTTEVRRCNEMERKVNYIKKELIKDGSEVPELWLDLPRVPNPREFIDLEAQFEKTENEILELSENFAQLLQNFQELTELRYVLERTQVRLLIAMMISF